MRYPVTIIVIAQLFGTSLWFSANSAADALIRSWAITPADIGTFRLVSTLALIPHRWQVRATSVRHLRRHANALAQRRVRVNGLADVHRVGAHLDGQGDLANHVARVGADHAAAQDLAVAPASMAVS